ncbi:hypothetical protein M407DRAFT_241499 [Tulasnella calospora MUT 4182]|uniref:Probable RNA-binding protein 18 n=1 Tax=Tulasnella calospora MUT 4182 TaxID=1051891 RepID=A0A0C3MEN8_9AGAM|nr:hypothetical protein M407DRAFT_241499 [Tulasnella calospora MUT 4182]
MEATSSSSLTPVFSTPAPTEEPSGSTGASTSKPSTSTGPIIIRKDRLYVGNLHPTVDEYILLQLFGKYGKISKLDFLFHKAGPMKGKPRGYAFVEYSAKEDASKALVALHDKLVRGRKLVVTFAQQSTASSQDSGSSSYASYPALGGSHNDRPGGRKGTDTTRPTTLSLIKSQNRPTRTSDKIAALEAKLKQIQASNAAASGSQSEAGGGGTISPEAATALGILPPKPPKAASSS